MRRLAPPWLPTALLSAILSPNDQGPLLGDLCEEYRLRASTSPEAAARWYWAQVIRSCPILLWRRARRGQWLSTAGIAVAAYVGVGVLNMVAVTITAPWTVEFSSSDYVRKAVVALLAIAASAHVASRLRPHSGRVMGCLVAVVAIVLVAFPVDASPLWYQVAFLVLGPVAGHLGSVGLAAGTTPTT